MSTQNLLLPCDSDHRSRGDVCCAAGHESACISRGGGKGGKVGRGVIPHPRDFLFVLMDYLYCRCELIILLH